MNSYTLLNCETDPFPGAPSKEFFCVLPSQSCCLKEIITAIKEKQTALHTLLGGTGAGKTTLVLQVEGEFCSDPNFSLQTVQSDWMRAKGTLLKNLTTLLFSSQPQQMDQPGMLAALKNHLKKPTDADKKTTVLLVDQAERIPSECLELLDQLFSDTIDPTIFQVVLVASPIYREKMGLYPRLSDKSNTLSLSSSISFKESKELLSYYLQKSCAQKPLESLVSGGGLYSLHLLSNRTPGRLLHLFRLTLCNMMVQDRAKAGILLCQQSAKELFPERVKQLTRIKLTTLAVTALAFLSLITLQTPSSTHVEHVTIQKSTHPESARGTAPLPGTKQDSPQTESTQKHVVDILQSLQQEGEEKPQPSEKVAASKEAPNKLKQTEPAQKSPALPNVAHVEEKKHGASLPSKLPAVFGSITVFEQETLGDMIRRIYGPKSFTPENTEKVLQLNPHLKDKNLLTVGDSIRFPTMPVSLTAQKAHNAWIHLVTIATLQDAYRFLRIYGSKKQPLLMFPSWSPDKRFQFSIFLETTFPSLKKAEEYLLSLSKEVFPKAQAVQHLDPQSFYYAQSQPESSPSALPLLIAEQSKIKRTTASISSKRKSPAPTQPRSLSPTKTKQVALLGRLTMPKGSTLGHMIRAVYGRHSVTKANISWLLKRNPQITNPNTLSPGTKINFAPKPVRIPHGSRKQWWIALGTFPSLEESYAFLQANTPGKPWLLILPSRARSPHSFTVVVEQSFSSKKDADNALNTLHLKGADTPVILKGLDSNKLVFEEKNK